MRERRRGYHGGGKQRLHSIIVFIPALHLKKRRRVLDEHITSVLVSCLCFQRGMNPIVAFTHYRERGGSNSTITRGRKCGFHLCFDESRIAGVQQTRMKVIGKTQQSRKCATTELDKERNTLDSSLPRLFVELVDEGTQTEIDPWNRIGDDF